MAPNLIPTQSRLTVAKRDGKRCVRCGGGRSLHWHHRRGKRVHDKHTHCACNGISLCTTCHAWVHAHPSQSLDLGYLVSRYSKAPSESRLWHISWGWTYVTCSGGVELLHEEEPDARGV